MRRAAVLTAVVAVLVTGAPALAAERGIVVGQHVFGVPPCGVPTVVKAPFADPMEVAGSDPTTCEIILNQRYVRQMTPPMRCTLVLHEYGHLAGRPHSADPHSVMYPTYVEPDERCVSTAPRGLG